MHLAGMGDVDDGGGLSVHVWRQEVHGKSLHLPLDFAVSLKLLYKIKSIKNFTLKERL